MCQVDKNYDNNAYRVSLHPGYGSVEECKTVPCLGYSLPAFTGFDPEDCHGESAMVMGSRDAKETPESLDEAPEPTYPLDHQMRPENLPIH